MYRYTLFKSDLCNLVCSFIVFNKTELVIIIIVLIWKIKLPSNLFSYSIANVLIFSQSLKLFVFFSVRNASVVITYNCLFRCVSGARLTRPISCLTRTTTTLSSRLKCLTSGMMLPALSTSIVRCPSAAHKRRTVTWDARTGCDVRLMCPLPAQGWCRRGHSSLNNQTRKPSLRVINAILFCYIL